MRFLPKEERNWYGLISIAALAGFLFVAPFFKGLFNGSRLTFEGPIHATLIGFSLLMILMGIHSLKYWKLNTHSELISIVAWLIPLAYLLSSIGAASAHYAMLEVHIKILWAFIFGLGAYLARNKYGSKSLQYLFIGSGFILVIYGLMNWFSNAHYTDGVLWYNRRLSNVFQYPNVYAAYLSIVYFGSLSLLESSSKWLLRFLYGFMLTPILLSFLLTLSRAAMISLAAGFLLLLIFFNWKKQLLYLLYAMLSGVAALFMYSYVFELGVQLHSEYSLPGSLKGWLIIFLGSSIVGAIITVIHGRVSHHANSMGVFNKKNAIIPLLLIVVLCAIFLMIISDSQVLQYLPDQIKSRISGIDTESSSLFQRNMFYKDAWEVIKDHMIKGTGGGGWATLYHAYKSYPYISNQAHNFYFQYVVETGMIGFLVLVLFLFYWLVIVIKRFIEQPPKDVGTVMFPVVAITLFIHSFFDFDMSYVYISAITFLMMGASIAGAEKTILKLSKVQAKTKTPKYLYASGLIIIGIFCLFYNAKALNAYQIYKQLSELKSAQVVMNHLNQALNLMPKHPDYHLSRINLLMQVHQQSGDSRYREEIEGAIETAKKHNPYHAGLLELEYLYLLANGQYEDALSASLRNTEIYPWEIEWYDRGIQIATQLGSISEKSKREEYWGLALELAEKVQRKHASILELPPSEQGSAKVFTINNGMASQLAQIYFGLEKYEKAIDLLKPFLTEQMDLNQPENKQIVRYYLLSIAKENGVDQYWWNKLIETDPSEEKILNQMLKQGE